MSIIMAAESWLLSQPSLLYTKTKCPIISNSIKPFKLQNPSSSCNNNSSSFSPALPLTTRRRRTRNTSLLTFAVTKSGDTNLEVFIGNLPSDIGLLQVFDLLKDLGTVVGIVINNSEDPGLSTYVCVTMKTVEEAEKAMEKFSAYYLNGELLTVSREKPRNSSEDLKFFVGNLTDEIYVDNLTALFAQVGTVVHAEVIYTWEHEERFGCVTMSTVEEVEKAVNKFNGYELNGKLLTVSTTDDPRKSYPDLPSRPLAFDSPFSVQVTGMSRDIDSARLTEIFSKYGKVDNVHIICYKETGKTRGFGFVSMTNETDMKNAIAGLHNKMNTGFRNWQVTELPRNL